MADIHNFLHMGGYAFEVWSTWGATLFSIVALVWFGKRKNKNLKAKIQRQLKRQALTENSTQQTR